MVALLLTVGKQSGSPVRDGFPVNSSISVNASAASSLAIFGDNLYISSDRTLETWSIKNGEKKETTFSEPINGIAASPSQVYVSVGATVRDSNSVLVPRTPNGGEIGKLAYYETLLIIGSKQSADITVFNLEGRQFTANFQAAGVIRLPIQAIAMVSSKIYCLIANELYVDNGSRLQRIVTLTGTGPTRINDANDIFEYSALSSDSNGKLYVVDGRKSVIYQLKINNATNVEIEKTYRNFFIDKESTPELRALGMVVDSTSIFILEEKRVFRIPLA